MNVKWQGVYPAVTTKFTADGELDIPMFLKNLEAQIAAGVDAIVLGGTLGEASSLQNDEKMELLRQTAKLCNGRIPVICNIAEQTTKDAVALAHEIQKNGGDGLMMLPPMRYKSTEYETVEFFKAVATSTDLPIMLYNNPVDYKNEVTLDMFEELLKYDKIEAVKESTRDISNITRIINRFGERLKILTGVDTLALESLLMGAHGWVAGLVDAFPAETVAIYRLAKAGRHQEAIAIYRWFLPILELDISPQLVQNIKLAEVATGIGTEHVRPPRLNLRGTERERVLNIINTGLKNRPALADYLNL